MSDSEDDKRSSSKRKDKHRVLDQIKTDSEGKPLVKAFTEQWFQHVAQNGYQVFLNKASAKRANPTELLGALVKQGVLSVDEIIESLYGLLVSNVPISTLASNGSSVDMDSIKGLPILKTKAKQEGLSLIQKISPEVSVKLERSSAPKAPVPPSNSEEAKAQEASNGVAKIASKRFWEEVAKTRKRESRCVLLSKSLRKPPPKTFTS